MSTKTNFLLPHRFQTIGWWGLLASGIIFIILLFADVSYPEINTPPVILSEIPLLASILLICISREKIDDEYINSLRGRTVCAIAIAFITVKILYSIALVICTCTGTIALLGIISFVNVLFSPIVLMVIYIIAFRIALSINKHKMSQYADQ